MEEVKSINNTEKSLYERHSPSEGKINITTLVNEIEAKLKTNTEAIKKLNEAMGYLAGWVEDQDKNKIILPNHNEFIGSTKI